jgi:exosome complex RNA-binding protein Rrp4
VRHAVGKIVYARIMGYNNDGALGILCHTPEDFHHVDSGFMVEIAGWLIAND